MDAYFLSYYSMSIDTSRHRFGPNNMAKKKYKRTKGVIARSFNFRKWGNYDEWLEIAQELLETVKNLFVPQVPKKKEHLKSAMKRLKLSEQEVLKKQRNLGLLALLSLTLGFLALAYLAWVIQQGHWAATPLSIATAVIAFALFFRYHFWYFQLRKGKLGCTVSEWLKEGFRRKPK